MAESKYRDVDSGKVVTLDGDTYARVAGERSKKLGGARYIPVDGGTDVAMVDRGGRVRTQRMTPDAAHHAAWTQNPAINVIDDSNREAIKALEEKQAIEEKWRKIAQGQGAEAFFGNLMPGSRSIGRLTMSDEEAQFDKEQALRQDQENAGAAAAGTIGSLVATAAVPVPGLGAASGLFKGAKTGKTAMNLLGFSDEVGNFVTRGVVGGSTSAGRQVAGKVAGALAGGAAINIPLSIQFQAAQAVDYDKPTTFESFARDLGTHVLIGAAFDLALPVLGVLGTAAKAASPVRAGGAAGKRFGLPGFRQAANLADSLFSKNATMHYRGARWSPGRMWNGIERFEHAFIKNGPRRMVGAQPLGTAAKTQKFFNKALNRTDVVKATTPAKWGAVGQGLDELASVSEAVASHAAYPTARLGADTLGNMPKQAGTAATKMNMVSETVTGYLRAPAMGNLSTKGAPRGLNVEMNSVAGRIADEVSTITGAERIVEQLRGLHRGSTGNSKAILKRTLEFRNRTVIDALKSTNPGERAAAQIVRKHLDDILTDTARVGPIGREMGEVIKATDDIMASVESIGAGLDDFMALDKHTTAEAFGAGKMGVSLERAQQAFDVLATKGVMSTKNAQFLGTHIQGGKTLLENVAPKFETVAAINAVRGVAGQEFKATGLHAGVKAGEDAATAGLVESMANYLLDSGKMVTDKLKSASTGELKTRGIKSVVGTAGIWQFRKMSSLDEKRNAYLTLKEQIEVATSSDEELINRVSRVTESLQDNPDLATAVAGAAVVRAQYLKSVLPPEPQGVVDYRQFPTSPAKMSEVLEVAGALEDPVTVMESALVGSLRTPSLKAVSTVYPNLLADMRVQLSEQLMAKPQLYGKLPYRIRLSVDEFLGGGFEPSAQPEALVRFQSRSAQTTQQDVALRGKGAMRAPQPGSDSPSDKLANF